jgi:hypothetical protein
VYFVVSLSDRFMLDEHFLPSLPTHHLVDQKNKQTSHCVFVATAAISQTAVLQLCDANICTEFLIPPHASLSQRS